MNLNNFQILDVSKDHIGRYLKLKVELPDGDSVIRWGLDEFTYRQIKEVVSKKYFDSLAIGYQYEMVSCVGTYKESLKESPGYRGTIRCIQGNRAARIEFPCSSKFAGNMEWFRKEVSGVEDIEHLLWEKYLS
ncbi:hypothetical protein ACQCVO_12670 [Bacillus infantis]|uniref:hypothetical protein n=1 Tax=Bacillus infantis TaxID=324767 RepID=UPI003CF2BF16